jgi:hypothetical protein
MRLAWSAVGALAVLSAVQNAAMNIIMSRTIERLQRARFTFQLTWFHSESPWDIFGRVISVKVYGLATAVVAVVGLMYMIGQPGQNVPINYALLLFAVASGVLFLSQYVPARKHLQIIYVRALKAEKARIEQAMIDTARLGQPAASLRELSLRMATDQLQRYSGLSASQAARPFLALLVPIATAVSTMARIFSMNPR